MLSQQKTCQSACACPASKCSSLYRHWRWLYSSNDSCPTVPSEAQLQLSSVYAMRWEYGCLDAGYCGWPANPV